MLRVRALKVQSRLWDMARTLLILLAFVGPVLAQDADTFKRVCPSPADLLWQQVDWEPSLWAGVVEAHKQKKPVMLWTMNGHPLGHT